MGAPDTVHLGRSTANGASATSPTAPTAGPGAGAHADADATAGATGDEFNAKDEKHDIRIEAQANEPAEEGGDVQAQGRAQQGISARGMRGDRVKAQGNESAEEGGNVPANGRMRQRTPAHGILPRPQDQLKGE